VKQWKNLQRKRSIYRGKGGSFKKRISMTVAVFPGDVCPLQRSDGDVFYQNSRFYSWNRIVGVNPLPRGASVGELDKKLAPSKCRICRIHENVRESPSGWKVLFREKETFMKKSWWISYIFSDLRIIRENNSRIRLLFANLLSISGWLETGEVQGIRNLWSSWIWWSLDSGTTVSGDFHE
jgi:hypothetical protein